MDKNEIEKYQEFFAEFESEFNKYEAKMNERRARGIHDFNIFNVLKTKEVKHSKFISALLDPKGEHYQGDIFLRKFLEACGINNFGLDTQNAQVFREYKNIDIYITDGYKHIIIENKRWTGDHDEQIAKYIQKVKNELKESKTDLRDRILVLYLTPLKSNELLKLGGIKEIDEENSNILITEQDETHVSFKHITYKKEILDWLNSLKPEIANLTDLSVLIAQYEKAIKNLTNQGEKMENENLLKFVKEKYDLSVKIAELTKEAAVSIMDDFLCKLNNELKNKSLQTDPRYENFNWQIKYDSKRFDAIIVDHKDKDNEDKCICVQVEDKKLCYANVKRKKDEKPNGTNEMDWNESQIVWLFEKALLPSFLFKNKDNIDKIAVDTANEICKFIAENSKK